MIVGDGSTFSSTFLGLLASRAVLHSVMEFDIGLDVNRDVELANREGLITANLIAEIAVAQVCLNAFALIDNISTNITTIILGNDRLTLNVRPSRFLFPSLLAQLQPENL